MTIERFLAERTGRWEELEELVRDAHGRASLLRPSAILRLGSLYRISAADLAQCRRQFPMAPGTKRLESLVTEAWALIYAKPKRNESVRSFLSTGIWKRFHENSSMLVVSLCVLFASMLLGVLWALWEPSVAAGILPSGFHVVANSKGAFYGISIPERGGLAVRIFLNNIEVSAIAVAGGFSFGIITAASLAYNGALIGVLGTLEYKGGGADQFFRLVLPHGLLELSCISLAGAAGFSIARALINPGYVSRSDALARLVPRLGATVLGVMMFLVLAGLTEGFITPYDLPLSTALLLGVGLGGSFWILVAVRGKRDIFVSPMT